MNYLKKLSQEGSNVLKYTVNSPKYKENLNILNSKKDNPFLVANEQVNGGCLTQKHEHNKRSSNPFMRA